MTIKTARTQPTGRRMGPGAVQAIALAGATLLACLFLVTTPPAAADSTSARPFVSGGYDDKPYIHGFFGRIAVGGYLEGGAGWTRVDGVTDELGVEFTRMNLLLATSIRDRVSIFGELEFEEGGDEITVEMAQVDVRFTPAFSLRGGILLLPLGRFNLAHDAPRNEIVTRPDVARELLGVALAQPGLGAFGRIERNGGARVTYELYAVTGYHDGLLLDSPDGTRLPAGRRNFEDANASPAMVGRVEWSPATPVSVGLSGYHGAYNRYRLDGLAIDERRDVAAGVLDFELAHGGFTWSGEAAVIEIEVPPTLAGLFAERQAGAWLLGAWRFGRGWIGAMPDSWFSVAVRGDVVDFDRGLAGDSRRSLSLGVNFRPVPETVLKLGYERGGTRDRFNNPGAFAALRLGLATYF
jgi:hypothetical protein